MSKLFKKKAIGKDLKATRSKSQTSITSILEEDRYNQHDPYSEGSLLMQNEVSRRIVFSGIQTNCEDVIPNFEKKFPKDALFVKVQLFSKYQHCGNVLIFKLIVWLDPETGKDYERPRNEGMRNIDRERSVVLKSRNENIFISLLQYSFPSSIQLTGTPVQEKIISDNILWEMKPMETEFTFILGVARQDLKDIYFSGALNIRHGNTNVLCTEPSLFFEEDSEKGLDTYQARLPTPPIPETYSKVQSRPPSGELYVLEENVGKDRNKVVAVVSRESVENFQSLNDSPENYQSFNTDFDLDLRSESSV